MNPEQFRRYRQIGTYGAYRVAFRSLPGLADDNGWTPGSKALALANIVNESLPNDARLEEAHFERGTRWGVWREHNKAARYWIEHGWANWHIEPGQGLLPTKNSDIWKPVTRAERDILAPSIFGDDSVRRTVIEVLSRAKSPKSHADLCRELAHSSTLAEALARNPARTPAPPAASLVVLPPFTDLADAAMAAMRLLWVAINQDGEEQAPAIEKLARSEELRTGIDQLRMASETWLKETKRRAFPHHEAADRLALAMTGATSTTLAQTRALVEHHQRQGGGRRWFHEKAGKLVPLVANTGIAASDYRFRLRPLCLLAAQCKAADMTRVKGIFTGEQQDEEVLS